MPKARNIDVHIISQNARGLKTDDKIQELSTTIKSRGYFAICIQETWRNGIEDIEHNGNRFIFNGLDKNSTKSRRGEQSVAIAFSPEAVLAWKAGGSIMYNNYGARILAVCLQTQDQKNNTTGIFLISAYAPVGVADKNVWEDFLNNLDQCISNKLPTDILIIGYDTNSSVGIKQIHDKTLAMNAVGKFGLPHVNNAGIRFSIYLETNAFVALTTYFTKKSYMTWMHPRSKLPHQIDHIITEKYSFRRFVDAGAVAPLIDSDHHAVFAKIRINIKFVKRITRRQKTMRLNHTTLHSPGSKSLFCQRVTHYYRENVATYDNYSKLENAMEKAAHDILPKLKAGSPLTNTV